MDSNSILGEIKGKLPKGKMRNNALTELKNRLDSLSENQRTDALFKIQESKLKSPSIVFLVGNFLLGNLGVGRFMIGDYVLGVVRFGLLVLTLTMTNLGKNDEAILPIAIICLIVMWVWYFADWFLVDKKLRLQNFKKIMQVIENVKGK